MLEDQELTTWLTTHGFDAIDGSRKKDGYLSIHEACAEGDIEVVEKLLQRGQGAVRTADEHKRSPFMIAASKGHLALCQRILLETQLESDPFPNPRSPSAASQRLKSPDDVRTPSAAMDAEESTFGKTSFSLGSQFPVFAEYGKHGLPDASTQTSEAFSADSSAQMTGIVNYEDAVQEQTSASGQFGAYKWSVLGGLRDRDERGANVMMMATESENMDLLRWIYEQDGGKDQLHERNKKNSTAIMWATQCKSIEPLKWFYSLGCSVTEANGHGNTCMLFSAMRGKVDFVEWLEERGCNVFDRNQEGESVLMLACYDGHLPMALWALSRGHSVHDCDHNGNTPLIHAAMKGHLNVIKALTAYQLGVVSLPVYYTRQSPLSDSASLSTSTKSSFSSSGFTSTSEMAIDSESAASSDSSMAVDSVPSPSPQPSDQLPFTFDIPEGTDWASSPITKQRNRFGTSAFLLSIRNGDLALAKWLYEECGISIHDTNDEGVTAAIMAAANGHIETLKWLHEQGASLTAHTNDDLESPMLYAARYGQIEVAKWIEELVPAHVFRAKNRKGHRVLELAVVNNQLPFVTWLLDDLKFDPTQCTANNRSTLPIMAALEGHLDMLRLLIKHGVSPSQADKHGTTPLMNAAAAGHLHIVKYLTLECNCNVDDFSPLGITAAFWAAQTNQLDILEFLYQQGAPMTSYSHRQTSSTGTTSQSGSGTSSSDTQRQVVRKYYVRDAIPPACAAAASGHRAVLRWLRDHGCSMNESDAEGRTPVLWASAAGQLQTMQWLLSQGCPLTTPSRSALKDARENDHNHVVEWISRILTGL